MNYFKDVPSLVRAARQGMNQRAFAKAIGSTQPMISRYERGLSSPPAEVVNLCMQIVHQDNNDKDLPSAEELASRVVNRLSEPGFASLRLVIAQLIDGVTRGTANEQAKGKA